MMGEVRNTELTSRLPRPEMAEAGPSTGVEGRMPTKGSFTTFTLPSAPGGLQPQRRAA